MKWYKHMSCAHKDDKIVSLRAKFGMWGIGVYWTLVELAAEQIEENSNRAKTKLIVSELLGLFGCKRNKLDSFLKHSGNVSLFLYEVNDNILEIDIPKLLEYADNYIKYDGKSLKTLQRQNKMSLKQEEEENRRDKKKSTKSTWYEKAMLCERSERLNNLPSFQLTWISWLDYRREIGKHISIQTARKQLEFLSNQNDPVGCINQSIRNGWQGLFECKGNNDGTNKSARPAAEAGKYDSIVIRSPK